MKITKTQLKQIIKEELGGALLERQSAPEVEVAEKFAPTEIGQKIIQQSLSDPEIVKVLDSLVAQLPSNMEEGFDPDMDAGPALGGMMAGPALAALYSAIGGPGMAALQAAVGPTASFLGVYGGTMAGGLGLGLFAAYMMHKKEKGGR